MSPWGDGLPGIDDAPPGAWGDGLPKGPADAPPQVSGAYCNLDSLTIGLYYDTEVNAVNPANPDDALNPANYAITGGVSVVSVALIAAVPFTLVYLTLDTNMSSINYTVTVTNVENSAGLVIDPAHDSASFWGPPHVVSLSKIDSTHFAVTYDSEVQHAGPGFGDSLEPTYYTLSGGLAVVSASLVQAVPTIVSIETDIEITEGETYTVTLPVPVPTVQSVNFVWLDTLRRSASVFIPHTQADRFIAEILIGGEVVWSAENALPQQKLQLDVRRFYGKLPLTFRIRGTI